MATGKPCFAGQIGRCFGPCSGRVTIEEHRANVDRFVAFMQNQDPRIVRDLEREMHASSAVLDYETAARKRDQLQAATAFFEKSAVVLGDRVDLDVFGIEHDELAAAVHLFMVRGGRIRGERSWTVDKELDVPLGELVDVVVQNAYGEDLTPALTGAGPSPRTTMYYYALGHLDALRWGPFKAHFVTRVGGVVERHKRPLLFNLNHDPGESSDISMLHPEVVQRAMRRAIDELNAPSDTVVPRRTAELRRRFASLGPEALDVPRQGLAQARPQVVRRRVAEQPLSLADVGLRVAHVARPERLVRRRRDRQSGQTLAEQV